MKNHFEQEDAAFRDQLARSCQFSDTDLAENRAGRLTPHQKTKLLPIAVVPLAKLLLSLVGLVGFVILIQRVDPPAQISSLMVAGAVGLSAMFFGLVAFVIKFLIAAGRLWNLMLDLSEGKVAAISGRLTASRGEESSESGAALSETLRFSNESGPIVLRDYATNEDKPSYTETHCFVVKGEYFEVSRDAYDAMRDRDGRAYRVYVTPRSRYLVALESSMGDRFQLGTAKT